MGYKMADVYVVSAFSKENKGGNKAGVVLNRPELTAEQKMKIAKELGYSETAFLSDSDVTAVCRNFAPLYGIDEESATGTSSCALAGYLFKYCEKKLQYIFEQGHSMGEASRLVVNVTYNGEKIETISVGGYGYLVCQKSLAVS